MSPRKMIFLAVVAVVIVGLWIAFSMMSEEKKKGPKGPAEMSVWVVWDDVSGFDDVVKGFKSKYDRYKATNVVIKKFASYADYEKTLLNVIADGNSPEVFTVSSDGGAILETKIEPLPDQLLGAGTFENSFNRVFDDLITEREDTNEEGKVVRFKEMKGIPLGYETMGAFYNSDIITNAVPKSWQDLGRQARESSEPQDVDSSYDSDSADEEDARPRTVSSTDRKYLAGLGLSGRFIPNAADVISLFFVQNGFETYEKLMSDNSSSKALGDYLWYGLSKDASVNGVRPNGNALADAKPDLEKLWIGVVDLFARWDVGVVFGYPSFLREIQRSVKRAGSSNVLTAKNLRTTTVPQTNPDKPITLAKYHYFALSKHAPDQQAGLDFLTYLMSKEAQEAYLKGFPYYLPAHVELAEERKSQSLDKSFPRTKYESFIPIQGVAVSRFDKGFLTEYDSYFRTASDEKAEPTAILNGLNELLGCRKRHLIEKANYDEACPSN